MNAIAKIDYIYGALGSLTIRYGITIPVYIVLLSFGFSANFFNNDMFAPVYIFGSYYSLPTDAYKFLIEPMLILSVTEIQFIGLIIDLGLVLFIPLGIVFRAFPFLRNAGGTLIGIGIGTSLVYPALLLFLNYPLLNFANTLFPTSFYNNINYLTAINNVLEFAEETFITFLSNFASSNFVAAGIDSYASLYTFLNYFLIENYGLYIVILWLSYLIDLIIGYAVTNEITKLLGGSLSLNITGRVKII